jgi:hypothetical protein
MCRSELTTKTSTAETTIGSHRSRSGIMPSLRHWTASSILGREPPVMKERFESGDEALGRGRRKDALRVRTVTPPAA